MIDDEELAKLPNHERWAYLVSNDRIDELLREVTEEAVAQTWARYENRHVGTGEAPADDPDWWAVGLWMTEEWFTDERRVREGILRLVELAANDPVLEFIGISIMEGDFFTANASRLPWIEEQAAASPRFRRTLAHLYVWGSAPAEAARRIERAAGVTLPGSQE